MRDVLSTRRPEVPTEGGPRRIDGPDSLHAGRSICSTVENLRSPFPDHAEKALSAALTFFQYFPIFLS
jgi:hypothetical protein